MDMKGHWEQVYRTKRTDEVSWFQKEAGLSYELIRRVAPPPDSRVIDVGGGASPLVDALVRGGYRNVAVLDLSGAALRHAQERLGTCAPAVEWKEGDVLTTSFAPASLDLWHDRAVFHFLTETAQKRAYVAQVRRALRPGGHAVIATFADDGPTRCSGLPVCRYSAAELHREFGSGFALIDSLREQHTTPSGAVQSFVYCLCEYRPAVPSGTTSGDRCRETGDQGAA